MDSGADTGLLQQLLYLFYSSCSICKKVLYHGYMDLVLIDGSIALGVVMAILSFGILWPSYHLRHFCHCGMEAIYCTCSLQFPDFDYLNT